MDHRVPQFVVLLVFIGMLLSAGSLQVGLEVWRGESPQVLALFEDTPTVANLRRYEKRLEEESWLARQLRPWMQYFHYILLGDAGEKVLRGPNGWFFYKPGVEYLTQRESVRRAHSEDPVAAICAFRDQLAARGIQLVVVPAPNKESVYPEQLSRRAAGLSLALCEQTQALFDKLRTAGVEVVDLFELFARAKSAGGDSATSHLYLTQDSHWSPAGLELAARAVSQRLLERNWIEPGNTAYQTRSIKTLRLGDVVRMMKVPQLEKRLVKEETTCVQVIDPDTLKPFEAGHQKSSVLARIFHTPD